MAEAHLINTLKAAAWGALEASVRFVSGHPGGPVTSIISEISASHGPDTHVEWSANEKEAFAGAHSGGLASQHEMDDRFYAPLFMLPMLRGNRRPT